MVFYLRLLILALAGIGLFGCAHQRPDTYGSIEVDRAPRIWPDLCDITIPVNIAPTNFLVLESGQPYYIRIWSRCGRPIEGSFQSGRIKIPIKQWRRLLRANPGEDLHIQVYVRQDAGRWLSFQPIRMHIAQDPVDPYLVYRLIRPLFIYVGKMGLYQRDLTSFSERAILLNNMAGGNCINCHAFHAYNPDRMIFHMRAGGPGTYMIMAYDGQLAKVDTRTQINHPTSYRCWHPNGRVIAFAFNTVRQVFHAVGHTRDVYDRASDLLLYDIQTRTITTCPGISSPARMETYPEWSPDGRYLYFCSGPALEDVNNLPQPHTAMRYDLMRIGYDPVTGSWGGLEMVLNASQMGLSAAHPKISPDGRYLLLSVSECTYFPLYRQESGLYLLDLQTGQFRNAEKINSPAAEGYHCWSSNGRWVVFSSKRADGQCTHLYLAYFDRDGNFHKPFMLPQEDPAFECRRVVVYNLPEFVKGPISISKGALIKTVWSSKIVRTGLDPNVRMRPAGQSDDTPYLQAQQR
ncbi:MAG: hypothetical protein QHH07_08430 [Sedimentisphaerales bacterium]|nr:hypothetical protein [Sedimentisphaerales bacterium]